MTVHTLFGQIVVGPPGSGKSTYCKYICENLKQLGRNAKIVNLDPANDCLIYKPAIDFTELINVQTVMEEHRLGPNGAIIHCMEVLRDNYGWLYDQIVDLMESEMEKFREFQREKDKIENDNASNDDNDATKQSKLRELNENKPYLIIDCPGQSELYTHHSVMKDIVKSLTSPKGKHFDLRLTCVNLCDAYHANDLGKYISVVMNSLSTMINLSLPHINILSKVDKLESYGTTRFNLDFYCDVLDLKYLLETELDSPFYEKYKKLSTAIIGVIEDYSLVQFVPLNIQQAEDIYKVLQMADRANGYYIDDLDLAILQLNPQLMEMASGRRLEPLENGTV